MTSWKSLLIVKMMTLYNYLYTLCTDSINKCTDLYYYLNDYILGHQNIWVFIPGHTLPITLNNLYNTIRILWLYNDSSNTLSFHSDDNRSLYKLSWLSAELHITDSQNADNTYKYNIDDFIEKFKVYTIVDFPPTLYMIFMCWCAYTKRWFKVDDIVKFHIIDDMGDEIVLDFEQHLNSITVRSDKLYVNTSSISNDTPIDLAVSDSLTATNECKDDIYDFTEKTSLLEEQKDKTE